MRLEDMHGRHFGRYEVRTLLGRGGMAAVYIAHDPALQRDVALKVLYPQYGNDATQTARFRQEAVLAAQLDHPHIVPIYDVGETGGVLYIAMRLLHGQSLADVLRTGVKLPAWQVITIINHIASALDYAHAHNIIHRDVKAGNVLLETDASGITRALLTDFGIAKSLDTGGMTMSGMLLGTPDAMAPEQISNQPLTCKVDVYALGVLAYRCLTGRMPFEGGPEHVLLGHLYGTPPEPSSVDAALPLAIDGVLRIAMARDPAHRYASAGAFAAALQTALAQPPADDAPTHAGPSPLLAGAPALERAQASQPAPPPTEQPASTPVATPRVWRFWPLALVGVLLAAFGARSALGIGTPPTATPPASQPTAPAATVSVIISTAVPTSTPTRTTVPTAAPTVAPTLAPTIAPTIAPTRQPTARPRPTRQPTVQPTPAPPPPTAVVTATVAPTSTPEPPTAAPTLAPTSTPEPTVAAACDIAIDRQFATLLENSPSIADRLGCPSRAATNTSLADQPFERGWMLWIESTDAVYTLTGTSRGGYRVFVGRDGQTGDEPAFSGEPPAGLYAPTSGFGRVWSTHDAVRESLGWATALERGPIGGRYQQFDNGRLIWSGDSLGGGERFIVLYGEKDYLRTAP